MASECRPATEACMTPPAVCIMFLSLTDHCIPVIVQLLSGQTDYLHDKSLLPLQILVTMQSCGLTLRICQLLQHGTLCWTACGSMRRLTTSTACISQLCALPLAKSAVSSCQLRCLHPSRCCFIPSRSHSPVELTADAQPAHGVEDPPFLGSFDKGQRLSASVCCLHITCSAPKTTWHHVARLQSSIAVGCQSAALQKTVWFAGTT